MPVARMAEGKSQPLDGRASVSGHPGKAPPARGSWAPPARPLVAEDRAKLQGRRGVCRFWAAAGGPVRCATGRGPDRGRVLAGDTSETHWSAAGSPATGLAWTGDELGLQPKDQKRGSSLPVCQDDRLPLDRRELAGTALS